MAVNVTPSPEIPGGYSVASQSTSPDVNYIFVAKQSAFTITINGLMPSSLHSVYFEGKKVPSTNIKPVGGKAGDTLYTDINGQAQFTFYYQSDVIATSSADRYNEIAQRVGGNKELAVVNSTDDQLPDNYEEAYTSYGRKNIVFKTTKISELPVKTNYSFAYPPNAVEISGERDSTWNYSDDDNSYYRRRGGGGDSD